MTGQCGEKKTNKGDVHRDLERGACRKPPSSSLQAKGKMDVIVTWEQRAWRYAGRGNEDPLTPLAIAFQRLPTASGVFMGERKDS